MNGEFGFIILGAFLFLAAFLLWRLSGRLQKDSGVPSGKIVYNDAGSERALAKPLFARSWGLVGKPDYLVELPQGGLVPVEVKSSSAPAVPHDGHVMQLAAYCLLVDETFGQRPPFGILRYADRSFEIDYTAALEDELLDLLEYMREDLYQPEVPRSHHEINRCAGCGLRYTCDASLI